MAVTLLFVALFVWFFGDVFYDIARSPRPANELIYAAKAWLFVGFSVLGFLCFWIVLGHLLRVVFG